MARTEEEGREAALGGEQREGRAEAASQGTFLHPQKAMESHGKD